MQTECPGGPKLLPWASPGKARWEGLAEGCWPYTATAWQLDWYVASAWAIRAGFRGVRMRRASAKQFCLHVKDLTRTKSIYTRSWLQGHILRGTGRVSHSAAASVALTAWRGVSFVAPSAATWAPLRREGRSGCPLPILLQRWLGLQGPLGVPPLACGATGCLGGCSCLLCLCPGSQVEMWPVLLPVPWLWEQVRLWHGWARLWSAPSDLGVCGSAPPHPDTAPLRCPVWTICG